MSKSDRPRAKALLGLHGFVDKNGDSWRDRPNGKPLVLEYATQSDQQNRQHALRAFKSGMVNTLRSRARSKLR